MRAHARAEAAERPPAAAAPAPLDALLSHPHVRNTPAILDPSDGEKAEFALAQDFFILQAERGRRREIEEAALTDWSLPLFGRGVLRGDALARYVSRAVDGRTIEQLPMPLGVPPAK